MTPPAVARKITAEFQSFSTRMQRVSSYVLDHPEDVALLSMREQARRAGVPPATMTRFAQRIGYAGYDELRGLFAASMRGRVSDFGARAGELASRRERFGEAMLAQSLANAMIERVAAVAEPSRIEAITAAAALLSEGRRILCLGQRSCYAAAFHFSYVAGLYGAPTLLLDAPGGTGVDQLRTSGAEDTMLAVSYAPYTRATVEIAASARELGIRIVALTDSIVSPLGRIANRTIAIPAEVADATHVASPAFVAAEVLAALIVAQAGPEGRAVLERTERDFARRRVYWSDKVKVE
jgi:DNA-binding MurR/RpiR family transcriptional regulator